MLTLGIGLVLVCSCGGTGDAPEPDGGSSDAAGVDAAGVDAGGADAGDAVADAGGIDAGDGGATPCTADTDCDDGDARTIDDCYTIQGICIHQIDECRVWSDCDDDNPFTDDECRHDFGSLDWICEHALAAGRCDADADCDDGLACSTETCVDHLCRYVVPETCVVSCEPYPACGTADAIGSPCGSLPVARRDCLVPGRGACPVLHLCGETFYAGFAAGPACPSTPCPELPPTSGDACGESPIRCDYGTRPDQICSTGVYGPTSMSGGARTGTHPEGHPQCDCRGGRWACMVELCPLTPPRDGDPAERPSRDGSADCLYRDLYCSIQSDPPAYDTFRWRCLYPRACPLAASDGASCDHAQDDLCTYRRASGAEPATQYDGECTCAVDGQWRCTANAAADCPDEAPEDPFCIATPGNLSCVFFEGSSATVTHRCSCNGLWNCTEP